jgi:hypothetical protein
MRLPAPHGFGAGCYCQKSSFVSLYPGMVCSHLENASIEVLSSYRTVVIKLKSNLLLSYNGGVRR